MGAKMTVYTWLVISVVIGISRGTFHGNEIIERAFYNPGGSKKMFVDTTISLSEGQLMNYQIYVHPFQQQTMMADMMLVSRISETALTFRIDFSMTVTIPQEIGKKEFQVPDPKPLVAATQYIAWTFHGEVDGISFDFISDYSSPYVYIPSEGTWPKVGDNVTCSETPLYFRHAIGVDIGPVPTTPEPTTTPSATTETTLITTTSGTFIGHNITSTMSNVTFESGITTTDTPVKKGLSDSLIALIVICSVVTIVVVVAISFFILQVYYTRRKAEKLENTQADIVKDAGSLAKHAYDNIVFESNV